MYLDRYVEIVSGGEHQCVECSAQIIDAIYIPLPNSLHAEWVELALSRNLHVLVEKPLACTYKEVVKLNSIASKKNLVLLENFQFRFHRQFRKIIEYELKC